MTMLTLGGETEYSSRVLTCCYCLASSPPAAGLSRGLCCSWPLIWLQTRVMVMICLPASMVGRFLQQGPCMPDKCYQQFGLQ